MDGATSNHGHGWCKDLKSILSPLARSAGFPGCGFTGLSSPVDQERATGKSPEPAGSKACATNPPRFMVPMRATYGVEALHEPEDTWLDSEELTYFRFMVPMRDKKGVRPTHEPSD